MEDAPEFGTIEEGLTYQPRPGAYVILLDQAGLLAVAQTPTGLYLPGGGQEAGESLQETAAREVGEECGLLVEVGFEVGQAIEYVVSPTYGRAFRKECSYFEGRVVGRATKIEDDHELVWMEMVRATTRLSEASDRWALERYLADRPPQSFKNK